MTLKVMSLCFWECSIKITPPPGEHLGLFWREKNPKKHNLFFSEDKPIGASPRRRRDEDGTILVCSTYSTYTVRIVTSKKGGNAPRATDKKSMLVSILILRKPRY